MQDASDTPDRGSGLSETLPGGRPMGPPVSLSVPRSPEFSPGMRIGRYEVKGRLGQGGMGVIYEAVDPDLGRRVAIKLLRCPSKTMGAPGDLLLEARATASLEHERFVRVYGLDMLPCAQPYLIMERLRGATLRAWLLGGPTYHQSVQVFSAVLEGMAYAHTRRVLHRDLKPENVFLTEQNQVKILDLGLAGLYDEPRSTTMRDARLALPGKELAGTPAYLAPECWSGAQPGPGVDVWAIGVMLYEALSGGQHPFWLPSTSVGSNVDRVQRAPYPSLPRKVVASGLDAIVRRALQRDPQARYADAAEMLAALQACMGEAKAGLAPSTGWLFVVLALLGATCVGLLGRIWGPPGWAGQKLAVLQSAPAGAASRPGMALVAAGTFTMGTTPQEAQRTYEACQRFVGVNCQIFGREMPQRLVRISRDFDLDLFEVTNEAYAGWLSHQDPHALTVDYERMVKAGGVLLVDLHPDHSGLLLAPAPAGGLRFLVRPGSERLPVVQVSWHGARAFCQAQGKDLPTEAQWEYAARGAEGRSFPWGEAPPRCDGVTFAREAALECGRQARGAAAVGRALQDQTAVGVFDLGGNVLEWVRDHFRPSYALCSGPCVDPLYEEPGPDAEAGERVLRGGNWAEPGDSCHGTRRSRRAPGRGYVNVGFRCAAAR